VLKFLIVINFLVLLTLNLKIIGKEFPDLL